MFLLVCQRLRTISLITRGSRCEQTVFVSGGELETFRCRMFVLINVFLFFVLLYCYSKNKPEGHKIKMMNYQDKADGSGKDGAELKQHRNYVSLNIVSACMRV